MLYPECKKSRAEGGSSVQSPFSGLTWPELLSELRCRENSHSHSQCRPQGFTLVLTNVNCPPWIMNVC